MIGALIIKITIEKKYFKNEKLGRNKLILCLASHGENADTGCGKIIYDLFLDEIDQKCATFMMNFLRAKISLHEKSLYAFNTPSQDLS